MSIKPIDLHVTYASTIKEAKVKQNDFNRSKVLVNQIQNQQEILAKKNLSKVRSAEGKEHAKISKEKMTKEQQNAKKRKRQNKKKSQKNEEENSPSTSKILSEARKIGSKLDVKI
ncbi:MAG: hypothetical protein ACLKAK_01835 [Alkaliphilus sp.]